MKANPSPMSVADYCHDFNNKKILVNEEYQRKVGLWTAQARSFFIESILLEFPIPKLDLRTRQQFKEVVDGQQRTQALVMFFNDKQRLTKNIDTEDLRGLKYSQLNDEWKSRFLSYSLPIDQFSGANDKEIREAFRRMNANNVPLNDEEQRNATFQGEFKWFIVKIADKYKDALAALGLFSRRDLIRMADLKFYAEVLLAIDSGFFTVKGKEIDSIYKRYNANFPQEEYYTDVVSRAIDHLIADETFHQKSFMRAHIAQSIVLAIIALQNAGRFPQLLEGLPAAAVERAHRLGLSLEVLAAALVDPDAYPEPSEFLAACRQKTNVGDSKIVRFAYFLEAIRERGYHAREN
jgi:hypothetical protein